MNQLERVKQKCLALTPEEIQPLRSAFREKLRNDWRAKDGQELFDMLSEVYCMNSHLREPICEALGVKTDAEIDRAIARSTNWVSWWVLVIAALTLLVSLATWFK